MKFFFALVLIFYINSAFANQSVESLLRPYVGKWHGEMYGGFSEGFNCKFEVDENLSFIFEILSPTNDPIKVPFGELNLTRDGDRHFDPYYIKNDSVLLAFAAENAIHDKPLSLTGIQIVGLYGLGSCIRLERSN